ncbi:anion permease [Trabulsiella odontotermitis]|uniref:2-oxoglutarate translocator n=1 Tax=Trabulsiella odontotermitis TaxID=379893 RepID=A0A0L0H235_9ENTR|nr:anion permease [Trabulsiella odontotermitis]KNC92131.1 2-oxoglutarate translocator [Trabulsiella odontotermitis]KNC95044.1 2-oxoglutarate translocator [Trabulsiella odontotermitis]
MKSTQSNTTGEASEKSFFAKYWPHLAWVGSFIILWFIPCPDGVDPKAWQLFAIFVATIVGFMAKPYPMAVIALSAIAATGLTKTLSVNQTLSGFSDSTIWLICSAFFISRAFLKTGLGNRIAYLFMSMAGKTPLGLAYATTLTNVVLAPVIPSNTARLGGVLYPLQLAISLAYDSDPAKGTGRRIGSFLMSNAFQGNLVISAMFLTAMASNPLMVGFAGSAGIEINWGTWFLAGSLPGALCLIVLPLILMVVWPPEIKKSPEAVTIAKEKLAEMGKLSKQEYIMLGVFIGLIGLWTIGDMFFKVNATIAALVGLAVLLVTRVLTWADLAAEKGAWNTLIWFSALVMMANFLNKLGLIPWLSKVLAGYVGGMDWTVALIVLCLIYVFAHYFFASATAHVASMYPAFLGVILAVGTPPMLGALALCFCSNLMGGITHYGLGSGPIFYDSGYIPLRPFWLLGLLFCIVFLAIYLGIGPFWWSLLGLY